MESPKCFFMGLLLGGLGCYFALNERNKSQSPTGGAGQQTSSAQQLNQGPTVGRIRNRNLTIY